MRETADKLNNQAILLAQDGSYKEAIACFVRALTIEKDNTLLWYNLGITYRDAGNTTAARECLEHAHNIDETDLEVIEELALICFHTKDYDSALSYSYEGLDINPQDCNLWNTVGVVHFNKAEYKDAQEAFEMAVMINPYYFDALYNLRDTYKEVGNKPGEQECNLRLSQIKKRGENY